MTYKEAAEILGTLKFNLTHCGGCYCKGDTEALTIAETVLKDLYRIQEATAKERGERHE